jgi:malate dehydrogenase
MTKKTVNVVVTGAAGQIGYAMVFRLASGAMLGPDVAINLCMLELEAAMPALRGVAMELEDCAFPLLHGIRCVSDINDAMRDANWALLVGAAPRKAGMERSELLKINGGIFSVQGKAINDHASSDVRVFVVGNPCNTNALIAMSHAKDVPSDRFFAMTTLDQNRAQAQLALRAKVPFHEVSPVPIWGNHSATQYPDIYHASIAGQPVTSVIDDESWLKTTFIETVQQRGAAVIKARGASSAASAANAALQGVYCLSHETATDQFYSMACCSKGEYGVDEGLIFSFPCRTEDGKCKIIEDWQHNDFSKEKIKESMQELRAEQAIVKDLGLID